MSSDQFQQLYNQLPPAAQELAVDYLVNLGKSCAAELPQKVALSEPIDISKEEFFGMWKDREDMQDSVAWVRQLRETEWSPKK